MVGDIIKIFAEIGEIYQKDEERIKNRAYEYDEIKAYLCDIKTKNILPHLYQENKNELIITRFGIGANSGNLFPNSQLVSKDINKNEAKFIKGILKSIENFLSYFTDEEIENNEKLKQILSIDSSFFEGLIDDIKKLEEHKIKGKKVATFFCLAYNDKPISAYYNEIFKKHISQKEKSKIYGYDILTNEQGVGGDANLAFCSVNELPDSLKFIKSKLLPLNSDSADKIRTGFLAIDKDLSHNFYGVKMAILPTILSKDETIFEKVLEFLKEAKTDIEQVAQAEETINLYLECVAKKEKDIPVLNTILFYAKNNSAVDVLLQIDDVLPSFISKISNSMAKNKIKAFKRKDSKNEDVIYLQNLFDNSLEIMNFLLSQNKIDIDIMIEKYCDLIYYGSVNTKYRFQLDWAKYFNNYYPQRSIAAIVAYQNLFNEIDVLNDKLTLQKECILENKENKKEIIKELIKNSEFLKDNSVLQGAYLLGMMSSALIKWQYAISESDSFAKWLNGVGAIDKDSLERIWTKCYKVKGIFENMSRHQHKSINQIKECLEETLQHSFLSEKIVKTSYVTLAFAMGGSDFDKHIKEKEDKKDNK